MHLSQLIFQLFNLIIQCFYLVLINGILATSLDTLILLFICIFNELRGTAVNRLALLLS